LKYFISLLNASFLKEKQFLASRFEPRQTNKFKWYGHLKGYFSSGKMCI